VDAETHAETRARAAGLFAHAHHKHLPERVGVRSFSVFEGNELRKNRYPYEHGKRRFGVDVFLGELRGLILAEVEFESDEEMMNATAPAFSVADVSRDERFTGGRLAISSAEELRGMLEEFQVL
jgi:CYTH domain-containing protein